METSAEERYSHQPFNLNSMMESNCGGEIMLSDKNLWMANHLTVKCQMI